MGSDSHEPTTRNGRSRGTSSWLSLRFLSLGALSIVVVASVLPAAAVAAGAGAGTIVNFAGSPAASAGNTGDGGPATSATLSFPVGVAVDSAGNVYVAGNNRIRRVDTGGTITNFAGSPAGTSGNAGDGGPATSAKLDNPVGITVDSAGNVYIADENNNRVRKVDTGGTITNLAGSPAGTAGNAGDGGPATSAQLNGPGAVSVDSAGSIYIADGNNHRVREVGASGTITNFAGSPAGSAGNTGDGGPATAATLILPTGLAVDSPGNVYIADDVASRVRKVNVGGTIANFAGSPGGTQGDGGDGGPATSATFYNPFGVTVDSAGNVYIADQGKSRVRKVDTGGTITNFTGGAANFGNTGDGGPAISAALAFPDGVTLDSIGNLYIADTGNQRLREVLAPTQAPSITSAAAATFTVGVAGSFVVTGTGLPAPTVTEAGTLPSGVSFDVATRTLRGTPAQATAGSYPVAFTAANGVGAAATQTFTLTVNQASFTNPTDGQIGVDPTTAFTWTTIPQAQGYYLIVGTTLNGTSLVNSGVLAATRDSYAMAALPAAVTLYATLLSEVNGAWSSYQSITFTVAAGEATFTFPLDGQNGVDTTKAFTWSTVAAGQGYYLTVGSTLYGADLVNSGVLPSTQSSYATPTLPAGQVLYATLYTEIDGVLSRFQSIFFTTGPRAIFTFPLDGQDGVDTTKAFTWSPVGAAQGYYVIVGSTLYGANLVNSGVLAAKSSSYVVPSLPTGVTLYATLFTEIGGGWSSYQSITFIAGPRATFTFPLDGQSGVDTTKAFTWSPVAAAQGYYLIVGDTLYGANLVNSGVLPSTQSSFITAALPAGRLLYAALFTELNGTWSRFQSIAFTTLPSGLGHGRQLNAPTKKRV